MKKYIAIAAVLAAVAFLGFNVLAQANETAKAPEAPAAMMEAAAPAMAPAADAAAKTPFMMDNEMCMTAAAGEATEEAKMASVKKCMMDKGHTEEEMMKAAEEAKAAADKAAMPMGAPTEAPAAK